MLGLPCSAASSSIRLAELADLAEAVEGSDVEVDGLTCFVGVALSVEHHPDEALDVGDRRGRPRLTQHGRTSSAPMSALNRAVSAAARSR